MYPRDPTVSATPSITVVIVFVGGGRRAAMPGVDLHGQRAAARRPPQLADDHEVIYAAGEHQDGAGDHGRPQHGKEHFSQRLSSGAPEVDGGLFVFPIDRQQSRPRDDHRVGQQERDEAQRLLPGSDRDHLQHE